MLLLIQKIPKGGTNTVGQVWCGVPGIILLLAVRLSSESEARTGCVWDNVLGYTE